VPGQIGLVQATEVIKIILGIGTLLIGKFYVYSALSLNIRVLETGKDTDCPLCGNHPRIRSLANSLDFENKGEE
jgi:molybdopterin/thiamine biosynthesis adenylyltransferase